MLVSYNKSFLLGIETLTYNSRQYSSMVTNIQRKLSIFTNVEPIKSSKLCKKPQTKTSDQLYIRLT